MFGYCHLDNWEKLKQFRLNSLERRRERFIIIYVWKIIERLAPNIGINTYNARRHGRLCVNPILQIKCRTRVDKLKENFFSSCGPTIVQFASNIDQNYHFVI